MSVEVILLSITSSVGTAQNCGTIPIGESNLPDTADSSYIALILNQFNGENNLVQVIP